MKHPYILKHYVFHFFLILSFHIYILQEINFLQILGVELCLHS
jgi:hypothetical protein